MNATTYTSAREGLAALMDRVCNDHEPTIVTRRGDQAVVVISLDDYKALEETSYLMRSPNNAKRLLTAIDSLNSGKGIERTILE